MLADPRRHARTAAVVFVAVYALLTTVLAVYGDVYATAAAPVVKHGFSALQEELVVREVTVEGGYLKIMSTISGKGILRGEHLGARTTSRLPVSFLTICPILLLSLVSAFPQRWGARLSALALGSALSLFSAWLTTPALVVGKLHEQFFQGEQTFWAFVIEGGGIHFVAVALAALALWAASLLDRAARGTQRETARVEERPAGVTPTPSPLAATASGPVTIAMTGPGRGRAATRRSSSKRRKR